MPQFLLDHEEGCTPLKPCRSCQALAFLRAHLKEPQFRQFVALMGVELGSSVKPVAADTPWDEVLELSVRTQSCLKNGNIKTIGDIVAKSEAEMLRTPNFGRKNLLELKEALVSVGHSLAE